MAETRLIRDNARRIVNGGNKDQVGLKWFNESDKSLRDSIQAGLKAGVRPIASGKISRVFAFEDASGTPLIIKCTKLTDAPRSVMFVANSRSIYERLATFPSSIRRMFPSPIAATGQGGWKKDGETYSFTIEHRIDGVTLRQLVSSNDARLTESALRKIFKRVATVLCLLAPSGFNHNDLHADNIMITKDLRPVIIDFDWACFWDNHALYKPVIDRIIEESIKELKSQPVVTNGQVELDWHRRRIVYMLGYASVQQWSPSIDIAMMLESLARTKPPHDKYIRHLLLESRKTQHNVGAFLTLLRKRQEV